MVIGCALIGFRHRNADRFPDRFNQKTPCGRREATRRSLPTLMTNLEVKNIPDELQERLQRQASRCEISLDEVLLAALEREAMRLEWNEKLADAEPVRLETSPSEMLARERAQRDAEF